MSTTIRIEISDAPTPDVVHRFRNFGEDVYRTLWNTCSLDLKEIDAATTSFVVRDVRKRDIGTVTRLIKEALRYHNFESSASLVRRDPEEDLCIIV